MKIRELSREDAKILFDSYVQNEENIQNSINSLDEEYTKIREDILNMIPNGVVKNYEFDLSFALKLYQYFSKNNFEDFNEAVASNYGFWRFICLKVVPDIIKERHGLTDSYFYEKNVRIYIPTLWWYIEMSYQGSIDQTYNCLKNFNTDYILQIVERPGRDGMYLDIARFIVKYLSMLNGKIDIGKGEQTLLRKLLIQHTARNVNYNLVVEGKAEQYVLELFKACGAEVEKCLR